MRRWLVALSLLAACATPAPPPAPPPAPAAVADPQPTHPDLAAELVAMRDADQEVRRRWIKDRENTALQKEVEAIDVRHVEQLTAILDRYGWPGKTMVGAKGSNAAWLIAQHGGPVFLRKTIRMMYEAVRAGELDEGHYATSLDRLLLGEGGKQIYGTQFNTSGGKCEPMPIDDPARVDERRIKAGMGPLADYQKQLCALYQGK